MLALLLWIIAVCLVVYGLFLAIARREILLGIALVVIGLLIGPGGVSLFNV